MKKRTGKRHARRQTGSGNGGAGVRFDARAVGDVIDRAVAACSPHVRASPADELVGALARGPSHPEGPRSSTGRSAGRSSMPSQPPGVGAGNRPTCIASSSARTGGPTAGSARLPSGARPGAMPTRRCRSVGDSSSTPSERRRHPTATTAGRCRPQPTTATCGGVASPASTIGPMPCGWRWRRWRCSAACRRCPSSAPIPAKPPEAVYGAARPARRAPAAGPILAVRPAASIPASSTG